jgi:DNA-binding transcriptional MerR regulator
MSKQYSISDLAKEFDVTTRTIRFYEDKGMLKPKRDGQKRIYKAADRTRLKLILRGKRIGLSLDESFDIIQLYTKQSLDTRKQLNKLLQAIEKQKEIINKKKVAILDMETEINEVEAKCLKTLEALKA